MKQPNMQRLRMGVACVCGLAVTCLSLMTSKGEAKYAITGRQSGTLYYLAGINQTIDLYRKQKNALPRTLGQLKSVEDRKVPVGKDDAIYDAWDRPFHYTVRGTHYLVVSYGRDGKPGGVGLDKDLTSENTDPYWSDYTFFQFLTHPSMQGVIMSACFCGVMTFLLCLIVIRPARQPAVIEPQDIAFPILRIGMTGLLIAVVAAGIASIITAFHVPTGH